MELAATQKLLARLCTDSILRNRFYADPAGIGRNFGLKPAESQRIAENLPQHQVHSFTKDLRRKRLADVTAQLPLSSTALGRQFAEVFKEYVIQNPPPEGAASWRDALNFEEFFHQYAAKHKLKPRWARQLLHFECRGIETEHTKVKFRIAFYLQRIPRFAKQLSAEKEVRAPAPVPSISIWWRSGRRKPIHRFSL